MMSRSLKWALTVLFCTTAAFVAADDRPPGGRRPCPWWYTTRTSASGRRATSSPRVGRFIGPARFMPCAAWCGSTARRIASWDWSRTPFRPWSKWAFKVLPTRTIYDFESAGVHMQLTFLTPMLPSDLDLVARPVTYLAWTVHSTDERQHDVSLYYDNSAELVVNKAKQAVVWSRPEVPGMKVMRFGSKGQPVLKRAGDNLRIDWGYFYLRRAGGICCVDRHRQRRGSSPGVRRQGSFAEQG